MQLPREMHTLILAGFAGWLFVAQTVAAGEIPPAMAGPDGDPVWVAAHAAFTSDGQVDPSVVGRHRQAISRYIARSKDSASRAQSRAKVPPPPELEGCSSYFGALPERFKKTSTLTDLTENAAVIVSGRVVAMQQGFYGGAPGTLLKLSADYVKGSGSKETFLFYPFARIKTAEALICAVPVGAYTPPRLGDRVLAFSMNRPWTQGDWTVLHVITAKELVHESGRELKVPPALRLVQTPSPEHLFDAITAAVLNELNRQCAQ